MAAATSGPVGSHYPFYHPRCRGSYFIERPGVCTQPSPCQPQAGARNKTAPSLFVGFGDNFRICRSQSQIAGSFAKQGGRLKNERHNQPTTFEEAKGAGRKSKIKVCKALLAL